MRSSAPLSTCGPGTRIMHGQTEMRRADELNSYRTAHSPEHPAESPAANGCRKTFALYGATLRRRIAPAAALRNTNAAADRCSTPKITAKATAPAAAASVKSHVGAGGAPEIVLIAFIAAPGASRPASRSFIARAADATRSIFTPVGSTATVEISWASWSLA